MKILHRKINACSQQRYLRTDSKRHVQLSLLILTLLLLKPTTLRHRLTDVSYHIPSDVASEWHLSRRNIYHLFDNNCIGSVTGNTVYSLIIYRVDCKRLCQPSDIYYEMPNVQILLMSNRRVASAPSIDSLYI